MRAAVISTPSLSSMATATPICASRLSIVVTSFKCGTLEMVRESSVRSAAASIGRAAFFAPDTSISPASGTPPSIRSLSMPRFSALLRRPVFRGQRLHRERVYLGAHALAQRPVHQLVRLHPRLAAERRAHDHRFEVLA